MNLNRIITFKLTLLMLFVSLAKSSASISLKYKNRQLIGLPKEYGRVTFDFTNTTLRIADKKVVLPQVLRKLFMGKIPTNQHETVKEQIQPFEYFFIYSDSILEEKTKKQTRILEIHVNIPKQDLMYGVVIDIDKMSIIEAAVYNVKVGFLPIDLSSKSNQ